MVKKIESLRPSCQKVCPYKEMGQDVHNYSIIIAQAQKFFNENPTIHIWLEITWCRMALNLITRLIWRPGSYSLIASALALVLPRSPDLHCVPHTWITSKVWNVINIAIFQVISEIWPGAVGEFWWSDPGQNPTQKEERDIFKYLLPFINFHPVDGRCLTIAIFDHIVTVEVPALVSYLPTSVHYSHLDPYRLIEQKTATEL